MTDLEHLIAMWEGILVCQVGLLTTGTINLVEQTITALQELKKLKGE